MSTRSDDSEPGVIAAAVRRAAAGVDLSLALITSTRALPPVPPLGLAASGADSA